MSADGEVSVVVVDDQAPFRAVARTLVSIVPGWRVVGEAETGEEAVVLVAAAEPDLVLMDINLPGIDGFEATRRIAAHDASARVVLVSTYAAEDLPVLPAECGAVGYIRKEDLTPALLQGIARDARAERIVP